MHGVIGLQHLHHGLVAGCEAEALDAGGHLRRFVAEHLQKPANAVVAERRTEQHRNDQALLKVALQAVEDLIARRHDIGEQLFHQMLVVIGELLQHLEAGFALARLDLVAHVDELGCGMLAIDVGALEREIDKSADDAVLPDRNLAQHERLGRHLLQNRENLAERAAGLVDLVDEQRVRNAEIGKPLQIGLKHRRLVGVGLAHDDGGVHAGQHVQRFLEEFDRTGAIEEGEAFRRDSAWSRQLVSTLIWRLRASGDASPTVFFAGHGALALNSHR